MAVFENQGLGAMIMQVAQTQLSFQAQRQQMAAQQEQMKMQAKEAASLQQMRLENVRLQDQNHAFRVEQFEFQQNQATTAAQFSQEKFAFSKEQAEIGGLRADRGLDLQERGLDIRENAAALQALKQKSTVGGVPNTKDFNELQDRVRDNKVGRFFANNKFPGITNEKVLQDRMKSNQTFLTRISESSSQAELLAAMLGAGIEVSQEERASTEALRAKSLEMKTKALDETQRLQTLIQTPEYSKTILGNLGPSDYENAQVPIDEGTAQILAQFEFQMPQETSGGISRMPQQAVVSAVQESLNGDSSKFLNMVLPMLDANASNDQLTTQARGLVMDLMKQGNSKEDSMKVVREAINTLRKGK